MRIHSFGRAGFSVSEIGFGAWGIGGATPGPTSYGKTDDAVSIEAIQVALDAGITFIDTSAVYGYGHSEEVIGRALSGGLRSRAIIATKAGLAEYGKPADFSAEHLEQSLTGSLARLRTDYVDVFQLHNPPQSVLEQPDQILDLVARLKRDGRMRAFGVSVRTPEDGFLAIKAMTPDAIQVNLNLLDQRALSSGFVAAAQAAQVAVIARTPLSFGFLSGAVNRDTVFAAEDHRSRWPQAQIDRWLDGADQFWACRDHDNQSRADFALRFCLSLPGVCSTIPGILTAEEARLNARAAALGPFPDAVVERLRAIADSTDFFVAAEAQKADPGKQDAVFSVACR